MSITTVDSLNRSMEAAQVWLKDLKAQGRFEDENQSYSVMRSVLHALRDRLPTDEAVHLAAQMPLPIRGVYFEGWKPSQTPRKDRTTEEFLANVRERQTNGANVDPHHATRSVFALLDDKITEGEIDDVKNCLPQEIRDQLWS